MTPEQFKTWRERMGLSQIAAAEALGLSRGSINLYERGSRREDGRPVVVPKTVELACAALTMGVRSYDGGEVTIAPRAVDAPEPSSGVVT
jgi:Predicted transcriptional regulators